MSTLKGRKLILKGRVIDCVGNDPIEKGIVVTRGARIVDVGSEKDVEVPKPDKILDCGDRTILPGLIDWHQHHVHSRPFKWYYNNTYGIAKSTLLAMHNSINWIKAGITTVRDYCGDMPSIVALRDEIDSRRVLGPRFIFVSGHDIGLQYRGYEAVRKRTVEIAKEGISDWIGLNVTGGFTSNEPLLMRRTYEEIAAVVEEAHKYSKKVDATLENAEACMYAVKAGVDCITHGMLLDEGSLEAIRKKDIFWSPILFTRYASCKLDLSIRDSDVNMSGLPEPKKREWIQTMKSRLEVLKKNVKKGYEMGIKILSGSDIPPPRVEAIIIKPDSLAREIDMIKKWTGMTSMEALMTATKYCGECLQMPIGTLEKGKIADIIVVEEDPIKNLRKAIDPSSIRTVIRDGTIVFQS